MAENKIEGRELHNSRRPPRIISDIAPIRPKPVRAAFKTQPVDNRSADRKRIGRALAFVAIDHLEQEALKVAHEKRLTVSQHLQEIKMRLTWSILTLIIGGFAGYAYNEEIVKILVRPLDEKLYYSSPAGGFDFLLKICLFFGFVVAVPVFIYNLLRFIGPAIPHRISYATGKILIISLSLALLGSAFAYFVSLPAALHFLNNFGSDQITSLISANEYLRFVMIYIAGFAVLFQMPLVLAFINKITPLSPGRLMKKQRAVILGSFIIAAILTPTPDPINQGLMAAPIIALYQSSIAVVWQTNRRSRKKRRSAVNGLQTAAA